MSQPTIDDLAETALGLPVDERAALAQRLWESLEGAPPLSADVEAEQIATARRRAEELQSGAVHGKPHDEVLRNARRAIE